MQGKVMKLTKALFGVLLVLQSLLWGEMSVDGELRLRFEYFDNMNEKYYGTNPKLGLSEDAYLLTRLRLGMTYRMDEHWSARVSMQDARALDWGFDNEEWYNKEFMQVHSTQTDYFELYETYLQYATSNIVIKTGRQKIAYGDNRVFGPGEWKNSGKWVWDAARVSIRDGENFLDLFYGGTMLHDPDEFSLSHRHGYHGGGAYGHYAFGETGAVEPIFAYKENDRANQNYHALKSYYLGARVYDDNLYGYFYNMTYMKSFGDFTKLNETRVDIDGTGFHLDAGYHFKPIDTKLGVGYTYASGDDPDTSDRETFDAVFGASDKYYGRLNLMSWSNLKDYEVFAVVNPWEKTRIKLEYHAFYADEPTNKWKSYTIPTMHSDKYGDEIDIVAVHSYSKTLQLQLGLGYFKCGSYIKEAAKTDPYITADNAFGLFAQAAYKF